jgi:hypothetical protein
VSASVAAANITDDRPVARALHKPNMHAMHGKRTNQLSTLA